MPKALYKQFSCLTCGVTQTHNNFPASAMDKTSERVCSICRLSEADIKKYKDVRLCLRCSKKFVAVSRFNKMCESCKNVAKNYQMPIYNISL